jgi:hypothetical protein
MPVETREDAPCADAKLALARALWFSDCLSLVFFNFHFFIFLLVLSPPTFRPPKSTRPTLKLTPFSNRLRRDDLAWEQARSVERVGLADLRQTYTCVRPHAAAPTSDIA